MLPKKVATDPPAEIQVMRCWASVSQNQSADSSVRSRKRASLAVSSISCREVRRDARCIRR